MFSKLRSHRPRHATVVAYLALFVALGGTSAYAANEWTGDNIVDESLTSDDLLNEKGVHGLDVIDGSLESVDLKNGTGVQGIDVVDASLTAADLATSAVTSSKIATSAVTSSKVATDSLGATDLAPGSVGASEAAANAVEASELTTINQRDAQVSVPASSSGAKLVTCLPGEQVISGGYLLSVSSIQVTRTFRNGNGWEVGVFNPTSTARSFSVHAYCLAE